MVLSEEMLAVLQGLENWEFDEGLVQKFLKYIYFDYLIPDSWREPTSRHYEAIEAHLKDKI